MNAKLHPFWLLKPPAVVCPEGEQMVNGGFETGDGTGWEVPPTILSNGTYAHSGNYYGFLDTGLWCRQVLDEAVLVVCIETFVIWLKCPDPYNQPYRITITYDDDSTSVVNGNASSTWTEVNLKPHLYAGKSVKSITILCRDEAPYQTLSIDDISMVC